MNINTNATGITPYLHYDDVVAMIDWLVRVFGCTEKGRWLDSSGKVANAELALGQAEIWLDGTADWWKKRGRRPEEWIGVWVNDVGAMHARVVSAGLSPNTPEKKFYSVRLFQVTDPEGYTWGFMQRSSFTAKHPD